MYLFIVLLFPFNILLYCLYFNIFLKAASFHIEFSVCLDLSFQGMSFFCRLSYQCHVSTLEAQEAC